MGKNSTMATVNTSKEWVDWKRKSGVIKPPTKTTPLYTTSYNNVR
jgi:hypothetical protein